MCIDAIETLAQVRRQSDFQKVLQKTRAHISASLALELSLNFPIELQFFEPANIFDSEDILVDLLGTVEKKITLNGEVIGYISVYLREPINEQDEQILSILAIQIASKVQSLMFRQAAQGITTPISLKLSEEEFGDKLAETLRNVTAADHVVLRRKEENVYRLMGYSGDSHLDDRSELVINSYFEPELKAFLDKFLDRDYSSTSADIYLAGYNGKRKELVLASQRVFNDPKISCFLTTPLLVAGEVTGIITFLFKKENVVGIYDESLMLLLTNHAAVGLANYFSAREVEDMKVSQVVEFIQATNFELVNGLRHSAVNNMYVLSNRIEDLENNLKLYNKNSKNDIYNKCLDYSNRLYEDLNQMELVVKGRYRHNWENCDLVQIFKEAVEKIGSNFVNAKGNKIPVVIQSSSIKILCYKDAILYAFINMLLNSKRAICESKSKTAHKITFVGRQVGDYFEIDISDTGVGIPLGRREIKTAQDIFLGGVTTKPDGTGWGLRMVQLVFQELHSGTISIKQTNPATFRIQLKKLQVNAR